MARTAVRVRKKLRLEPLFAIVYHDSDMARTVGNRGDAIMRTQHVGRAVRLRGNRGAQIACEPIEIEVTLRERNQLTLPAEVVDRLGAAPGDRFIVTVQECDGKQVIRTVVVRPVRRSYARALEGVYGTPREVAQYLKGERDAWE